MNIIPFRSVILMLCWSSNTRGCTWEPRHLWHHWGKANEIGEQGAVTRIVLPLVPPTACVFQYSYRVWFFIRAREEVELSTLESRLESSAADDSTGAAPSGTSSQWWWRSLRWKEQLRNIFARKMPPSGWAARDSHPGHAIWPHPSWRELTQPLEKLHLPYTPWLSCSSIRSRCWKICTRWSQPMAFMRFIVTMARHWI